MTVFAHGTDVSVGISLLSGENLLQEKNSTGSRWDSNPGPCIQHSHSCKSDKPLRHLALKIFNLKKCLFNYFRKTNNKFTFCKVDHVTCKHLLYYQARVKCETTKGLELYTFGAKIPQTHSGLICPDGYAAHSCLSCFENFICFFNLKAITSENCMNEFQKLFCFDNT